MEWSRAQVVAARIRAQQLDRPVTDRPVTDAAILDFGVQDTGRDGASWALANRGVPVTGPAALERSPELALAWTLRGAPHYYRRSELAEVVVATSPFSDADADKRIVGAGKPLHEAGIASRAGLTEVAGRLRGVVVEPMVKGEVSSALTAVLDEPYLRNCVPCGCVHAWEVPFRIGALYVGLELQPGTSPPVLRRIPGWRRPLGPADDPLAAPPALQVIRNYLRFCGPAGPKEVAGFLDAPVAEIKRRWPEDAEPVSVAGVKAWALPGAAAEPVVDELVRLLGPYDLLLQARDRSMLLPDTARHKALWPVIGRPGAVLVGTEVVGLWRPKADGRRFTLRLELWAKLSGRARAALDEQAESLATHRGLDLAAIDEA